MITSDVVTPQGPQGCVALSRMVSIEQRRTVGCEIWQAVLANSRTWVLRIRRNFEIGSASSQYGVSTLNIAIMVGKSFRLTALECTMLFVCPIAEKPEQASNAICTDKSSMAVGNSAQKLLPLSRSLWPAGQSPPFDKIVGVLKNQTNPA